MPRVTFLVRLSALVSALVVAAGLALVSTPAGASAGPVRVPVTELANGATCPEADAVVVSPGSDQSQVFLVVPPGPAGCPGGLDLTVGPGAAGAPAGVAVTLPLTADSCQAGTALLDSQIVALGQTPGGIGSGPPGGGNSACPDGDAASAQLIPTVTFLPRLEESLGIYYFFQHDAAKHALVDAGAAGVFALAGEFHIDIANGTPEGVFTLSLPGSNPVVYVLQPSSTAAVATIACVFCSA
jgi:hypothetical protein